MSAPQQAPRTIDEVQALVAEEMARARERRRREERSLPQEPLFWLAAVSHWTEPLFVDVTERLLGWKDAQAQRLLRDLEERGWLRRLEAARRRSGEVRPALLTLQNDVAERQINSRLETRRGRALWDDLAVLVDGLQASIQSLDPKTVPDSTKRWTELAAASVTRSGILKKTLRQAPKVESWQPSADELEGRLDSALASQMPGQGQRWLETAQSLASLLSHTLDTTLDIAVRRSALRVELHHRRRHDLKHLKHFLERDDQLEALERLIRHDAKDPSAPWALHLLGGGGVGKTMLVRHLTAKLADQEHWGLSIGRVDFDFLNPDYPRRSPGLLLWAFAQELRIFDTSGRVGQAFDDSERVLRQLHDQLHAGEVSDDLLSHPLLQEGIAIYGQALEMLPQPVVFVIDTCEELTKPRAGIDGQFNVEATFAVLEALHERVPTLRVVFAGRRPLVAVGFGWTCPQCTLPPRPFLRLFEMRGFSETEAKRYLAKREVSPHLVDALVQRSSPDSGSAAEIHWEVGQGPKEITRCNPYELHFYAEWALDDPPPSPEDIETAGGHRYVELRILRRLGHGPLEQLLPLLGLARHADEALLQAVSGLQGDAFEDLLRELENQEWVELRSTTSTQTSRRIYSVEEGLRLRLLSYCRDHAGEMESQRRLAVDVLRRRILEGDPAELDGSDLDAALRVMESEPDVDLWWRDVEARLFSERDAEWVAQQMSLLEGTEGAAAKPDDASWPELRTLHPLRPAVQATLALAQSRQPGGGLTPWMDAADAVGSLPNIGVDLALRARAMVLAAQHVNGFNLVPGDAWDLWRHVTSLPEVPTPETVAALVAAAEAIVEHYEEHRRTPGTEQLLRLDVDSEPGLWATAELHRHITRWLTEGEPPWKDTPWARQLEAMSLALDGRVVARLGDRPEEATERFRQARRLAAGQDGAPSPQAWSPPENFFTRLKLEAMRALYPRVLSAAECLREFGARAPAEGVEWDRFLSQQAELALASALEPQSELFRDLLTERLEEPIHEMLCRAHFEIPPFAVRATQLLEVSEKVEHALEMLQDIVRQAASLDITVVHHAARAHLDLSIRLRLFEGRPAEPLADSPDPGDHVLVSLAFALGHSPITFTMPVSSDTRALAHARWQTSKRPVLAACQEAIETARHRLEQILEHDGVFDLLDAHLILDGREATLLPISSADSEVNTESLSPEKVERAVLSALNGSRETDERWRLYLRQLALGRGRTGGFHTPQAPIRLDDMAQSFVDRLGQRRAALIAWREADLLALRLPPAASYLFGIARRLFEQADDALNEAICLTAQHLGWMSLAQNRRLLEPSRLGLDGLKACWRSLGATLESDVAELEPHLRPWWMRAQLLLRHSIPKLPRRSYEAMTYHLDEPLLTWIDLEDASEEDEGALSKSIDPPQEEQTGALDIDLVKQGGFGIPGGRPTATQDPNPNDSSGSLPPPSPPEPVSKESPQPPQPQPQPQPQPGSAESKSKGSTLRREWNDLLKVIHDVSGIFLQKIGGYLVGVAGGIIAVALVAIFYFAARWRGMIFGIEIPGYGLLLGLLALILGGIWSLGIWRTLVRLEAPLRGILSPDQEMDLYIELLSGLDDRAMQPISTEGIPRRRSWRRRRHLKHLPEAIRGYLDVLRKDSTYAELLDSTHSLLRSLDSSSNTTFILRLFQSNELAWEGMLSSQEFPYRFRFRRGQTDSSKSLMPWAGPLWLDPVTPSSSAKAVRLACRSKRILDTAHRAWHPLREAEISTHDDDLDSVFAESKISTQPERVLHLLGVAIETSGGYRFRLQDESNKPLDLRAQDLRKAFPELAVLILQESPVSEILPRSDADRRQAGYLRAFAAETQEESIPAVLTIPHLLPETASRCIEEVARLMIPYPFRIPTAVQDTDPSLLDTVDAIRRHIRRDDTMDDEAAWDVVLYSPPGWRNPFQ